MQLPDLTTVPLGELETAYDNIRKEIDRRLGLEALRQQAERLAHRYEAAVEGKPAKVWQEGMVIGPGERVVEDGVEYTNRSGAWLSVPPSKFILGYYRSNPIPVHEIKPWVPGETITQAMLAAGAVLRELDGVVYQAVQPHTTAPHWAPNLPGMTALWVVADAPGLNTLQPGRKGKL